METVGHGDAVLVCIDGIWCQGVIVDVVGDFTVLFEDGSHAPLNGRRFVPQRASPAWIIAPGSSVLVKEGTVLAARGEEPSGNTAGRFMEAVVVGIDEDGIRLVVGTEPDDFWWATSDAAKHDPVEGVELDARDDGQLVLQAPGLEPVAVARAAVSEALDWRVCRGDAISTMGLDPSVLASCADPALGEDSDSPRLLTHVARARAPGGAAGGAALVQDAFLAFDRDADGALSLSEARSAAAALLAPSAAALLASDAPDELHEEAAASVAERVNEDALQAAAAEAGVECGEAPGEEGGPALPHAAWPAFAMALSASVAEEEGGDATAASVLARGMGRLHFAFLGVDETAKARALGLAQDMRQGQARALAATAALQYLATVAADPEARARLREAALAVGEAAASAGGELAEWCVEELPGLVQGAVAAAVAAAPHVIAAVEQGLTAAWLAAPGAVAAAREAFDTGAKAAVAAAREAGEDGAALAVAAARLAGEVAALTDRAAALGAASAHTGSRALVAALRLPASQSAPDAEESGAGAATAAAATEASGVGAAISAVVADKGPDCVATVEGLAADVSESGAAVAVAAAAAVTAAASRGVELAGEVCTAENGRAVAAYLKAAAAAGAVIGEDVLAAASEGVGALADAELSESVHAAFAAASAAVPAEATAAMRSALSTAAAQAAEAGDDAAEALAALRGVTAEACSAARYVVGVAQNSDARAAAAAAVRSMAGEGADAAAAAATAASQAAAAGMAAAIAEARGVDGGAWAGEAAEAAEAAEAGLREAVRACDPEALSGAAEGAREAVGAAVQHLPAASSAALAQAMSAAEASGAGDAFAGAASAVRDAYASAGGGEAAAAAANAALTAGGDGVEAAAAAVSSGHDTVRELWDSGALQGVAGDVLAWSDGLDETYTKSRAAAAAAMLAVSGIATSTFDWIKFDVVRDAYQVLSLVLTSVRNGAMSIGAVVWGRLAALTALDLSFLVPSIPAFVVYILLGIVGAVLLGILAWLMCQASSLTAGTVREGHEGKDWSQLAKERPRTVKGIEYALTACLSMYLPLSRTAFQILACDTALSSALKEVGVSCTEDLTTGVVECKCSEWGPYGIFQGIAVLILLVFTLGLPLFVRNLILKNRPVGSPQDPDLTYDEDGEPVPYTDERYNDDVLHDVNQQACPYTSLYKGYERKWAYYKVVAMVFKLAVALPVIFLFASQPAQLAATLVVTACFAAASVYTSPFVDAQADVMDMSGRISTAASTLFGLIGLPTVGSGLQAVMGVLINLTQAVNVCILGTLSLAAVPAVSRRAKSCLGRMTVNDTLLNVEGRPSDIMPRWNVYREVRRRVWYPFWDSLLLNGCGEEVAQRLLDLQKATSSYGIKRIREHFAGMKDEETYARRQWVLDKLEGLDVYWNEAHDGELDSKTCFGKMYVVAYPFHCVMVYDDSDDVSFVWNARTNPEDEKTAFTRFVELNQSEEVQRRRLVRRKLRALKGERVHLEHQQTETHTVPDGFEEVEDEEGNVERRQQYSQVTVEMSYHNGTLQVGSESDSGWSAGFAPRVSYGDGHGEATLPRTGEVHQFRNMSTSIGGESIGVTDTFEETPRLQELLEDPENQPIWEGNLEGVEQKFQEYREGLNARRREEEATLSSSFWIYVYYNMDLTREALQEYLEKYETNEVLHDLPNAHAAGLDYLFKRMQYLRSHPCCMLWYVTWDSVWECNGMLSEFEGLAAHFDPRHSSSIAYRPMPQEELDAWFAGSEELSAVRQPTKFVSDRFVNVFYAMMEVFSTSAKAGKRTTAAKLGDRGLDEDERAQVEDMLRRPGGRRVAPEGGEDQA